jgi:hypothetical protein
MKVKYFDPMNATFSTWMAEYEKNEKITIDIRVGRNIFKNVKYKDLSKITSGYSVYDVRKFNYSNREDFKFNRIWKKVFRTFI